MIQMATPLKTFIFLCFFCGVFLTAMVVTIEIPARYWPWAALDLNDRPGIFTAYKLSRLQQDPVACHAFLDRSQITYTALPDRVVAAPCRLQNVTTLRRSLYPYNQTVTGNCGLTAALVFWEHHVVRPAAEQFLSSPITRIHHAGIYACRNIRGSATRPSQHATANAIDISGFTLKNGRRVTVASHWSQDSAEGRFLKNLRDQSCGVFGGVLGPDYNALHRDHFHLDLGPYKICR